MAYKHSQLREIANESPQNLVFFKTEHLKSAALNAGNRYSDSQRIACTAELLVRRSLKEIIVTNKVPDATDKVTDATVKVPDATVKVPDATDKVTDATVKVPDVTDELLDEIFPNHEWRDLERLLGQYELTPPTVESLKGGLWKSDTEDVRKIESVTRSRLVELFDRTDGFIPVYDKESKEAFFIPFHLEDLNSSEASSVVDANGVKIDEWTCIADEVFDTPTRCVVRCVQENLFMPLTGRSCMLPLWMAGQRRNKKLPAYNRLRLLATGEIRDGRLVAVEVNEKLRRLQTKFPDGYMLFPETSSLSCGKREQAVPLDSSCNLEKVREDILREIEAKGLVTPTFRQAMERLRKLEPEVRNDCFGRWRNMLARVETYSRVISERRSPKMFLCCLMLKSVIHCHMGESDEALALNAQAKAFARKHGYMRQLHLLEIEELVELQDKERFEEVLKLSESMKDELEAFADKDLLMRYHGTLGQAHAYGVLSGAPGFSKEMSREHFERACDFAVQLDSERDIAQDFNYLYLWQVLFNAGSVDAQDAYREAHEHQEHNLQEEVNVQFKNKYFLRRFKLMEMYRRLLGGQSIAPINESAELLPHEAVNWLRALCCKYMGACAAAEGRHDDAHKLFCEGRDLLNDDGVKSDSVLAMIRMTISAEAYRSLGDENSRKQALDDLSRFATGTTADVWRRYLCDKGAFSGLSYWY